MPALPTLSRPPVASSGACRPDAADQQPAVVLVLLDPGAERAHGVERRVRVGASRGSCGRVTGSSHIAPKSAARCEIDLSAGGV